MTFVPDTPTLVAFVSAALLLAATPGPDMTLFIGRTLAAGRAAGLAAIAGTTTGCLMHTLLVSLGIAALLQASPAAFAVLKVAGAAYLLYLAWGAVRHGSTFDPRAAAATARNTRSLWREYVRGWAVNALNPKIVMFFVAFFPTFVSADDPHAAGKLLFLGVVFALVALPLMVPLVFVADALTAALRANPRVTRVLDWLFATVFAMFAVRILLTER